MPVKQDSRKRLTTIKLAKEYMKFSAAHFTIFSATQRERLHGHNFQVEAEVTTPVASDGICFSYQILKDIIKELCDNIDEYILIPQHSPHLSIEENDRFYDIHFNDECFPLLKSDTILLPIANSTVEAYSDYLLNQFLDSPTLAPYSLHRVKIGVSSAPGQWGYTEWFNESL